MASITDDRLLYRLIADGLYGAVAGLAGSALLTGTLLLLSEVGAFDLAQFADIPAVLGLGGVLTQTELVVVGYVIFVAGGMITWPLVLASIGTYLPGDRYATRGIALGGAIWTGFALANYSGYTGGALVLYLAGTALGHVGYGYVTGGMFDSLFGERGPRIANMAASRPTDADNTSPTTAPTPSQTTSTASTSRPSAQRGDRSVEAVTANAAAANGSEDTAERTDAAPDAASTPAAGNDEGPPDASTVSDDVDGRTVESGAAETGDETPPESGVVVTDDEMPPLLQFNRAFDEIEAALGDPLPERFVELREAYEGLVAAGDGTRHSRVSDFESRLTAAEEELDGDRTTDRWLESMHNRVDLYLGTRSRQSDTLHLSTGRLYQGETDDGSVTNVTDLQSQTATFRATVANQGERAPAVVRLSFYSTDENDDRVLVRSEDLPMGHIEAGEVKTMETSTYVPSIAEAFDATVLDPADGQTFLTDADARRGR